MALRPRAAPIRPGCRITCDGARTYPRISRRSPLLKAATGEIATEEDLGGAEMHTYFRPRRLPRRGRSRRAADRARYHGQAGMGPAGRCRATAVHRPPRHDPEEFLGIVPMDYRRPFDMRQVIARIVDDSDFLEFAPRYGPPTVTAMRPSKAMRSASSPITGRSTSPARPKRRISFNSAASRARRSSI